MNDIHRCTQFRQQRREGVWHDVGLFRKRDIERASVCVECGRERAGRFRNVVAVEKEAKVPVEVVSDPFLRRLARLINSRSSNRSILLARPLLKQTGGVRAEADLERLATSGTIRLVYVRESGSLSLQKLCILNRIALTEIAYPGAVAKRDAALADARRRVNSLAHPEAVAIRELLGNQSLTADERVIKSLAGLAELVGSGEALPWRAFSARVLGDSKSFSRVRNQVERLVGPVERLGIRDSGALVLMGGDGHVVLRRGEIDVGSFHCLGLSSEDIKELRDIEIPEGGIFVIENLTPFQACLHHLKKPSRVLALWSGGFPNQGVIQILTEAASRRARIRVWCDIDLGGVRIARLIHHVTSGVSEPILMGPEIVNKALIGCRLSALSRARIMRDIEMHPDDLLAKTLQAVLERGEWVEQETLLSECWSLVQSSI